MEPLKERLSRLMFHFDLPQEVSDTVDEAIKRIESLEDTVAWLEADIRERGDNDGEY